MDYEKNKQKIYNILEESEFPFGVLQTIKSLDNHFALIDVGFRAPSAWWRRKKKDDCMYALSSMQSKVSAEMMSHGSFEQKNLDERIKRDGYRWKEIDDKKEKENIILEDNNFLDDYNRYEIKSNSKEFEALSKHKITVFFSTCSSSKNLVEFKYLMEKSPLPSTVFFSDGYGCTKTIEFDPSR